MNSDAQPESPTLSTTADRDEILELLEDGIREAHRKVESGRVYDEENERVRIQWIRALAYASGQYRQLKKDEELDTIHAKLDRLEEEGVL